MKVITLKSNQPMDDDARLRVHHGLGMEQYSDHVIRDRQEEVYSATIVVEDSTSVIEKIVERSKNFPEFRFVIDDLNMDANTCERYHISDGLIKEKLRTGWTWE